MDTTQNNTSQPQGYTCTGDCLRCSQAQRQYCAAQFTFKNMRTLEALSASILALSEDVKNLSEKVNAIQSAESELFNPDGDTESPALDGSQVNPTKPALDGSQVNPTKPIAQEGSGVTK